MTDFVVTIFNPLTRRTERSVKLEFEVFHEDTYYDLMNKIWISTGIPPYRQHLFTNNGWHPYQILVDGIVYPIGIKEWFDPRVHASEILISGVPINKHTTENKDGVTVDVDRMYQPVGRTRAITLVDLDSVITRDFVDSQDLKRDNYICDLVYYGAIVLFWPLVAYGQFKTSFDHPDQLIDIPLDIIKNRIQAGQKIAKDVSKYESKSHETAILSALYSLDFGVRRINLRIVFDWIATSKRIPCIVACLFNEDRTKTTLFVKKHISYHSSADEYISRIKTIRNFRKAREFIEFIIRKDDCVSSDKCSYLSLRMFDGEPSMLFNDFKENDKVNINKDLEIAGKLVHPIIHTVNTELGSVALPYGGLLGDVMTSVSARNFRTCFYWKRVLSLNAFLDLKEKLKTYERAGILAFKPEECSHNSYVQENCFLITFYRGIGIKSGVDIKISLRTTDIRMELLNARSQKEFEVVQKYMFYFLEHHSKKGVDTDAIDDMSKRKLKTLKEKDPLLYDLKKYNPNNKVYSVLCQSDRQPTLYTPDEVKHLSNTIKNRLYKFWNFTTKTPAYYDCSSKEFPYLSFKVGKHPEGFCLPCCKKSDVMEDSFVKKMEKKCFADYIYSDYESQSSHILTFGKDISIGRISKLPQALTRKETEGLFLLGVQQHLPSINNVGYIFSIAASLMHAQETPFFKFIADKIAEMTTSFNILGYGAGAAFDSSIEFADELLRVFVHQDPGFSVLTDEQWIYVFTMLVKDIYNVNIVVYQSLENDSIEINEDTELDGNVIVVVGSKTGRYPVVVPSIRDPHMMLSTVAKLNSIEEAKVDALVKIINSMMDNSSVLNPLEVISAFIEAHPRWNILAKLVDARDLCYGLLLSGQFGNVYLPVRYSLHHKYFTKTKKIVERPQQPYPHGALMDFITSLNEFNGELCGTKLHGICPEYYVRNFNGKIFGFKSGKLYYFFDPIDGLDTSLPSKLMPFDPAIVDREIKCSRSLLVRPDAMDNVARLEYRNRLYRIMVGEFINKIRKDRNQAIRKKIVGMMKNISFESPVDYQNFYDQLETLDISADDRRDFKLIVSRFKNAAKISDFIKNTTFEFDHVTLMRLATLNIHDVYKEVKAIMDPIVSLVDDETSIKTDNIYIPCARHLKNAPISTDYCEGPKLRVAKSFYEPFLQILANDVHNGTVLLTSYVFDIDAFIRRPDENITAITK